MTQNGDDFLLSDSGPTDNRIVVFSTSRNLELLVDSEVWFADDTFKHVPLLFHQLHTIHTLTRGTTVLLIYIMLPNKGEEVYKYLLESLLNRNDRLNSTIIVTDFEKAAMNAFGSVFLQATQHGCFFHFYQAIFLHIQQCSLQKKYKLNSDFVLYMRFLPA